MRATVKGIQPCVLHLSHCSFHEELILRPSKFENPNKIDKFDHTQRFDPLHLHENFQLDLSKPYDAVVAREMIRLSSFSRGIILKNISYQKPGTKGKKAIKLIRLLGETHGRELADSTTARPWIVPSEGILTFTCSHSPTRPVPLEDSISDTCLDNLVQSALKSASNGHLGESLNMLLMDVYMFTEQVYIPYSGFAQRPFPL